jgi:phosphoribosylaminoimidazole-succinocarboxamide synthase
MCEPFKIEMVIRGYLSGHAAREYSLGKRLICGVPMPDDMKENDKFPEPIITPATKAALGDHDEDISKEDIISKGIASKVDYTLLEKYARDLFKRGTKLAQNRGLILVDTKYEFGKTKEGKIVLIDEIHTPDSSRYFYADGYHERQNNGEQQKQLSKEFVRQWLLEQGFQGLEGQTAPEMSDAYVQEVSDRYIELYEQITGKKFKPGDTSNIATRINDNVTDWFESNFM